VKVKPRGPTPGRLAAHRRVERTRRLALPLQAILVIAVLGVGVGVLFVASGGLGRVAAALGTTLAGLVEDLTTGPDPTSTPSLLAEAPVLDAPAEPYTNLPAIDLVGRIPSELVGDPDHRIRLYLAIGEQSPTLIKEIAMGPTQRFLFPGVSLIEGTNTFTTTIDGPAGESEPSPAVTYVLDVSSPGIRIRSPLSGDVVNAAAAELVGETQPRSEVRLRNASTNASVTGQADDAGAFRLTIPIQAGSNELQVIAIDPAGNQSTVSILVNRGSGELTAALSATAYNVKVSNLPTRIVFTVLVGDPDGRPLEGATVTFTLAVPSVSALASRPLETGGDGGATWSVTIPAGATTGQGQATVIVQTADFGDITNRTVVTIVK
jgi:hypothetical protein